MGRQEGKGELLLGRKRRRRRRGGFDEERVMRKKENEGGGEINRDWWELGAKKGKKENIFECRWKEKRIKILE